MREKNPRGQETEQTAHHPDGQNGERVFKINEERKGGKPSSGAAVGLPGAGGLSGTPATLPRADQIQMVSQGMCRTLANIGKSINHP